MNKRFYFTLFVIAITFSLKAQYYGNETNDSIIWVDNVVHDFGVIFEGEKVKHTYKLKNLSKDTLYIISHNYPTGCKSDFSYSKEKILPNSFFEVELGFNSSNTSGNVNKDGSIKFNSGLYLTFSFNAKVLDRKSQFEKTQNDFYSNKAIDSIIWVDNEMHDFGEIFMREQVKHTYKLKNLSKDTLTIVSVERPGGSSNSPFNYSHNPILPNSYFYVDVYVMANYSPGINKKTGSLRLNNGIIIYLGFSCFVLDRKFQIEAKLNYDYSTIKEKKIKDSTLLTYTLKFTNKGLDTLKIVNFEHNKLIRIKNYTTSAILPNHNGEITVEHKIKNSENIRQYIVFIKFNNSDEYYFYFNKNIVNNYSINTEKTTTNKKPKKQFNKKKIK